MKLLEVRHAGRRVGISELTGTLMMIAITLVAGAAVLAWVNSQAAVSESAYGQRIGNQVDFYNEQFVIVSVQFSERQGGVPTSCVSGGSGTTYCNTVSVAIYNTGNVSLQVRDFSIENLTDKSTSGTSVPKLSITSDNSTTPLQVCASSQGDRTVDDYSSKGSTVPVGNSQGPPTVFTFTLPTTCYPPSGPAGYGILLGASYQVQVVGRYGNVVTVEVTAGD